MSWVTDARRIKSGLIMGFSDELFTEKVQNKYRILQQTLSFVDPDLQWHNGDTYLVEGIEYNTNLTYMITGVVVEPKSSEDPYVVVCNIISGKPFITILHNDDIAMEQYNASHRIYPSDN